MNVHEDQPINRQEKQHRSQQLGSPNRRDDTVTISKKYLEDLLHSSYMKDHVGRLDLTSLPLNTVAPATAIDDRVMPTHVEVDHSHIPGLEDFSTNRNKVPARQTRRPPKTKPKIHSTREQGEEEDVFIGSAHPVYDPPPLLPSLLSPRAGETYHRGTYSRPIHPAMRSNIVFGSDTYPTTDHLKLVARRKLQEDLGM